MGFLAACAFAGLFGQLSLSEPKQIEALLKFVGLRLEVPGQPDVVVLVSSHYGDGKSYTYEAVLEASYRPAKPLDRKVLEDFRWRLSQNRLDVALTCGIGDKITIRQPLPLGRSSLVGLRRAVEKFDWVRALTAIEFPVGNRWSKPWVDEDQVIKSCSNEDLSELVQYWGWETPSGMMPSMGGEVVRLGFLTLLLQEQSFLEVPHTRPITLHAHGRTPGIDTAKAEKLQVELSKRYPELSIMVTESYTSARMDIDLSKGMKIKDIKKRILGFVSTVRGFILN